MITLIANVSSPRKKLQVLVEAITVLFGDLDDPCTESATSTADRRRLIVLANFLVDATIMLDRPHETSPIFRRVLGAIGHVDDRVLRLVHFGYDAAYGRIHRGRGCRDFDDIADPFSRRWHDLEIRGG